MITQVIPQTIEEAFVLPLIATSQTTEERVATLMTEQQRQTDEVFRLIHELEAKGSILTTELDNAEKETVLAAKNQAEEIRKLNERIDLLIAKNGTLQSKVNELDKKRDQERENLRILQTREKYLHTEPGLLERANPAIARKKANASWKRI